MNICACPVICSKCFTEVIDRLLHLKRFTNTMHPYLHVINMLTFTADIPVHTQLTPITNTV